MQTELTQVWAQIHANECGLTEGMAIPLYQVLQYLKLHPLYLAHAVHSPETREEVAARLEPVTPELVDKLDALGIDYICLYKD